jgi:hypothetical protein
MANGVNPAAPHHLPSFITAPGETDYFFRGCAIFVIVMVVVLGTFYFRLYALPGRVADDQSNRGHAQVVGVLALLALLTQNNVFWIAALLLAFVPLPNLATPLAAMATSLAKLTARWRRKPDPNVQAR